ncbi:TetR/AcrR family transcriptional regulator [Pseudoteredinibacter isoporae]|uniref:AcrR family transcriptional regulator n=1 Tax=Pseudoteredinibacter isoporae TaxID=570281 RepID=A0A7X0MUV3_9GAMM|nr:TetR/AcrR family transcriptional regulator [Pseudoteredinibacter isoporae]MBB6521056.1 AcrR family transcriptional regulator [Pseudoteredinibacter isoporae]NHO86620.1 TetR/AcrR family transcriptional regulator [Pseudoteredinibacter isoporae]NIB24928.1 TetR/AcrR family transcriptional regulator [Pseudoteredinibacter isoporae]
MVYRVTEKTLARKADNKAKILAAARKIVAESGFSGLTIAATAKQAGLATGSMYRYFPNKVELCTALFRQLSGREVDEMHSIAQMELNPAVAMARCCFNFTQRAFRAPTQSYALIAEPLDPALEAERLIYRRAYAEVYQQIIEQGIGSADFSSQDSHIASLAVVGMLAEPLLEPLHRFYSGNEAPYDSRQLALDISRLCLNALGAHELATQQDLDVLIHEQH